MRRALSGLPRWRMTPASRWMRSGGRPGVYSARYAGEGASDAAEQSRCCCASSTACPRQRRGARYRCVIAFVRSADDPAPLLREGAWEGAHRHCARRASGGFGYDPLFMPRGSALTAAQMSAADKNAVSHRGARAAPPAASCCR